MQLVLDVDERIGFSFMRRSDFVQIPGAAVSRSCASSKELKKFASTLFERQLPYAVARLLVGDPHTMNRFGPFFWPDLP